MGEANTLVSSAFFSLAESAEAGERLEAFRDICDGFELAEVDFRLRGPGDLFGTNQHGLPPLRVADLLQDGQVSEEARQAATELLQQDPNLEAPEHQELRRRVMVRYGQQLEISDVG